MISWCLTIFHHLYSSLSSLLTYQAISVLQEFIRTTSFGMGRVVRPPQNKRNITLSFLCWTSSRGAVNTNLLLCVFWSLRAVPFILN